MLSSSSSPMGLLRSSISLCQVYACSCSGVIDIRWPGVGVAMFIALTPVGVVPLGVNPPGVNPPGVNPPGVIWLGVWPPGVWPPGVRLGVVPPGVIDGVIALGVDAPGVSSHRDRLLLAEGVGVLSMRSPPRSVLGVSAQPLPCPGVPWPGVAWPGVSDKTERNIIY